MLFIHLNMYFQYEINKVTHNQKLLALFMTLLIGIFNEVYDEEPLCCDYESLCQSLSETLRYEFLLFKAL